MRFESHEFNNGSDILLHALRALGYLGREHPNMHIVQPGCKLPEGLEKLDPNPQSCEVVLVT